MKQKVFWEMFVNVILKSSLSEISEKMGLGLPGTAHTLMIPSDLEISLLYWRNVLAQAVIYKVWF